MNKTAAMEWLEIAYHDLKSAKILYDADHFTDSIGCDLQQALEKSLKSIIASQNNKIPKSHDLYEIYVLVDDIVNIDDKLDFLYKATEYYKEDRYPNPNYSLPPKKEIEELLQFTEVFFEDVCKALDIDKTKLGISL